MDHQNRSTSLGSFYDSGKERCWYRINRYYAMNFDYFEMEPHVHQEFEIMYIASGSCNIYSWTKDNQKEEWKVREGEYVFLDCNVKHQLEVIRGVNCRILNLELSVQPIKRGVCLQQYCEEVRSLREFLVYPAAVFRGHDTEGNLHTIITELQKQYQNPLEETEHQVQQNLLLTQLFIELGRQRMKKYSQEGGSKYVRMALSLLSASFDEEIKVTALADKIGISGAYLQRLFKEQTGMTLVEKVNELRIEKAKLLLETSRLPITDIAISVGFNNRQHFTYTFHKLTGCSPAVYCKHKGDHRVWKEIK